MREVDWEHLENPVGISFVHLETLDGHGGSQVFPAAYFRVPAVVTNPPKAGLLSENVRGRYDPAGFTYLRKEPQTPPAVFLAEA